MTEPYQEERFEYKGYPCVILLMPMGYRCGYVGLPKTSKFYGKDYDKIDVICNGGLTYGVKSLCNQTDKDVYWIGFDCAHYWDLYDIKTQEFVHAQCESIVDQIIKLERGENK